MNMKYEPVIGLEVHAELLTKSKMFVDVLSLIRSQRSPTDISVLFLYRQPGSLPVLNNKAVVSCEGWVSAQL